MKHKMKATQFAVLGLGRFGLSIVQTLSEYDVNILACDKDPNRLQDAADYATHLVQMDISDEKAMENLGLGNFDVVVLAMGEDFETSQMAAMVAKEQGAQYVMVKATSHRQQKILESIGVDHVVFPEHEMGVKTARKLVGFNIVEVLEESEHYTITEMYPMTEWIGKTLGQADIRKKENLMVLGVRRNEQTTIPVPSDWTIREQDVLITLSEHEKR